MTRSALARLCWPRDRWLRIRNIAFAVFLVPGLALQFLPTWLARAASMVGLIAMAVCLVYGYEAWRRDRPHTDTYSGDAKVIVHCSDPEQHDRHHHEDVHNPNAWLDEVRT